MNRSRSRTERLLGLVVAALALVVACSDDASPPEPPEQERPEAGSLIDRESIAPPGDAPAGTQAWRIRYRSTGVDGDLVEVTGVLLEPPGEAPEGGRPVLSFAHGTTGLADECAPSLGGAGFIPYARQFLDSGYTLVATDYEGLGGPGVHPYLVGESEGRSVLDAARVAVGDGHGPVTVFGYSQGGHAALFAGQLAASYAPEVDLVGVVAGAPPTDLEGLGDSVTAHPFYAGFQVLVGWAWSHAYPELDLADVLTEEAVEAASIADRSCAQDVILAFAGKPASELVAADAPQLPDWSRRIRENRPSRPPANLPVLVIQGDDDDLVPAALTQAWVADVCRGAASLTYLHYAGRNHLNLLEAAGDEVVPWIEDRVAGRPDEAADGQACVTRSAS